MNNITLIIPEMYTIFKTLGLFSFLRFAMGIFQKHNRLNTLFFNPKKYEKCGILNINSANDYFWHLYVLYTFAL